MNYNKILKDFIKLYNIPKSKLLLEDNRVDLSSADNYVIRGAAYKGHTEIVKLLLEDNRVDPSARDNYVIKWAAYKGHTEIVKLLKEKI